MTWSMFINIEFPLIQDQVVFAEVKSEGQRKLQTQAQKADKKLLPLDYMLTWNITTSALLSDFIVVWRAWVLFQQERFWKMGLLLLMIVNIGINIADCILNTIEINMVQSGSIPILDWLSLIVSLIVNMFATGLIAWKAWNHYHIMRAAAVHRRTRVQKILLLLIESGAIYCAIQALYLVFYLVNAHATHNGLYLTLNIVGSIFNLASAWYPIAVVILVNMDNGSHSLNVSLISV
ncbi:hypothetical protein GYMLUDRAFT_244013 [Collybiopsis luxurians FD-317 M1]|uniref:Uncharacterized protein n=1 Tax=Collybiopsis luxurians FD-317 M1 TaxID=944289 RepID=A0A0D0BAV1_9AGAR|nr:hypothetical protein GYMLUDRAFT_244013 [Collybiopsis luxurians FD-317 M1]